MIILAHELVNVDCGKCFDYANQGAWVSDAKHGTGLVMPNMAHGFVIPNMAHGLVMPNMALELILAIMAHDMLL